MGRLLVPRDNPDGVLDDEGFAVPADPRRMRDYSREGVRRSLESSLERVKMDRVDILFVHDPDDHEQPALDDALPALEELRSQGAITSCGAGIATNRPRRTATYDYRRAPEEIIERAAKIAAVCEPHGPSLPAAAGQFPVGHPTVATVCLGARSAAQVKRNAAPFDAEIPAALWEEPSAEGLLRDEAPTP